jgi:hypothetical protein
VTTTTPETTVSLTLRLPRSLHAAAMELATREDRTLNNLVVHLLRGEGTVVTPAKRRRLRAEIEAGTDAELALRRAGI